MAGLSVEELRTMEGIERENIEARIQWLRDIQSLLDGAMLLINQYNTVAANSRYVFIHLQNLTHCLLVSSANNLCKQVVPRSGLTKCRA